MKKALVLLAEGFEEIEAIAVIDILRRGNVTVHVCSLDKEHVTGAHSITVKSDVRLEYIDIKTDNYDLIYLPGGIPGATNLRDDPRVIDLLKQYDEEGAILSAICAGPIVLERAGLLADKEVTSFPSFKKDLHFKAYHDRPAVVSGNVVTGRGAGTAMELGFTLLEELGLKERADKLREDMQYNLLFEK